MLKEESPVLYVDERSTLDIHFIPTDTDRVTRFPLAQIDSMKVTILNDVGGEYVNSRNQTSLITNGAFETTMNGRVVVNGDGEDEFWFTFEPDDNAIIDTGLAYGVREKHLVLFFFKTASGKERNQEFVLKVKNFRTVTS